MMRLRSQDRQRRIVPALPVKCQPDPLADFSKTLRRNSHCGISTTPQERGNEKRHRTQRAYARACILDPADKNQLPGGNDMTDDTRFEEIIEQVDSQGFN